LDFTLDTLAAFRGNVGYDYFGTFTNESFGDAFSKTYSRRLLDGYFPLRSLQIPTYLIPHLSQELLYRLVCPLFSVFL
jgi:hypothetical protein